MASGLCSQWEAAAGTTATRTLTEEHTRAVIATVVAALVSGCVVPSPGVVKWWICVAYGPQATVEERRPDGTVIERRDGESDPAIRETMRACRE